MTHTPAKEGQGEPKHARAPKKAVNLYLENAELGTRLAQERYGLSLSGMVDRLILVESRRRNGVLGKRF